MTANLPQPSIFLLQLRAILGALLLLGLLPGVITAAGAAPVDPEQQFTRLQHYYQRLLSGEEGRTRENWQRAGQALQELQRQHPAHEAAPKSLYLQGNLYHQMYRRGGIPEDLAAAVTSFQRMQAAYPRHPLADDALFYLANIFLHEQRDPARAERVLTQLVTLYPDGDMAAGAREKLQDLQREAQRAARAQPPPVISPPGPPKVAVRAASPAPAKAAELAEIMPVRHWSSDTYTRVVIETSAPVTFHAHLQDHEKQSQQLSLELTGARLGPRVKAGAVPVEDGLLKQVSHLEPTGNSVRLVLETQSRIDDYKIFSLDNPFRVVIDLMGRPAPPPPRLPDPPPILTRPGGEAPLSLARQLGLGVRRIVIDPGHGGKDPGAISPTGIKEKDLTLRISRLLAAELRRQGSEVHLTRDRDVFLALEERTAIANSKDADLFISVHVNSAPNRQARGVETYVLDMLASDDEAMRTAARENASSARSFSDLQGIIQQLLNHTKLQESIQLAEYVHQTTVTTLRRAYDGRIIDRGVRRAPFVVLVGARMPAVLVEVGFMSNPEEERLLTDEQYLNRLAQGIAAGIGEYAANLSLAER